MHRQLRSPRLLVITQQNWDGYFLDFLDAFMLAFFFEGRPVLGLGTKPSTSDRNRSVWPATLSIFSRPRRIKSTMAGCDTPRMRAASAREMYSLCMFAVDVVEVSVFTNSTLDFLITFFFAGRPVFGCATNASTSERRTSMRPAIRTVVRRRRRIKSAMACGDTPRMRAASA